MKIKETNFTGLFLGQIEPSRDERGSFTRLFCPRKISETCFKGSVAQVNLSQTHKVGTVRGLHYQKPPMAEDKVILCLNGKVFDVAVDLRKGSSTFLKSFSVVLSAEQGNVIVIPQGFAHGFQVLEMDSELIYFHSQFYHPEAEAGLKFDDPRLQINWPLPVASLSQRDKSFPLLDLNFEGFKI